MLHFLLVLHFLIVAYCTNINDKKDLSENVSDLDQLVSSLQNDRNSDLSRDEEYEDLRAELLAYQTALNSISPSSSRKSLKSTPCWTLGGICVNYKLCSGFRFLTEVPGCKDNLNVCCFTWNRYRVRDFKDKGIGLQVYPWHFHHDFGGKGIIEKNLRNTMKMKNKGKKLQQHQNQTKTLALVIRSKTLN